MENGSQAPKYTKSFVKEDKVSVSKDRKKIIIYIGNIMVSLNIAYVRAILNNLEKEQQSSSETAS